MGLRVINTFRDLRTDELIEPGMDVPAGLSEETIERLIAANCILQDDSPAPRKTKAELKADADAKAKAEADAAAANK